MLAVSVSLQAVTFDLSCCHQPGDLNERFSALTAEVPTHMTFEAKSAAEAGLT
jgi:hypothetical protein